jgi:phosphopantothenoylcysteine decarboxylase/phosphopantothenate--cysteine ligase
MYDAVLDAVRNQDIFVATAAVADYRPAEYTVQKIKRHAPNVSLELKRTPDILAAVAALQERPFTVGFAAETEALGDHARAKLRDKQVDMVAANLVGKPGSGMEVEDNALYVVWGDGEADLPLQPKGRLARQLIAMVAERYNAKKGAAKGP